MTEEFKSMKKRPKVTVLTPEQERSVPVDLPSGIVMVNGLTLINKVENRIAKATYGILPILQLRHIAALKLHYSSTTFTSVSVPRGRPASSPVVSFANRLSRGLSALPRDFR